MHRLGSAVVEREIEPSGDDSSVLPFEDLVAPAPIRAAPPHQARWFALAAILLGGFLGATLGYGIGDVMGGTANWQAGGAFVGGVTAAVGVGIVANLTLRAMNEWRAVKHPEAEPGEGGEHDADSEDREDSDHGTEPDS